MEQGQKNFQKRSQEIFVVLRLFFAKMCYVKKQKGLSRFARPSRSLFFNAMRQGSMKKYKVFTLEFDEIACRFRDEEFDKFLNAHHIVDVHSQFFEKPCPCWTFLVIYKEIKSNTDDPLLRLNAKQKQLYETLRYWRNQQADQEDKPPFVLFTNQQLLQIVMTLPHSLQKLGEIHGIGKQKLSLYGKKVLELLRESLKKTSRKSSKEDVSTKKEEKTKLEDNGEKRGEK